MAWEFFPTSAYDMIYGCLHLYLETKVLTLLAPDPVQSLHNHYLAMVT